MTMLGCSEPGEEARILPGHMAMPRPKNSDAGCVQALHVMRALELASGGKVAREAQEQLGDAFLLRVLLQHP